MTNCHGFTLNDFTIFKLASNHFEVGRVKKWCLDNQVRSQEVLQPVDTGVTGGTTDRLGSPGPQQFLAGLANLSVESLQSLVNEANAQLHRHLEADAGGVTGCGRAGGGSASESTMTASGTRRALSSAWLPLSDAGWFLLREASVRLLFSDNCRSARLTGGQANP